MADIINPCAPIAVPLCCTAAHSNNCPVNSFVMTQHDVFSACWTWFTTCPPVITHTEWRITERRNRPLIDVTIRRPTNNGNHLRIVNRRTHVVNTGSVTYVSRGSSCAARGTTGSLFGSCSQRYRARSSTYWRLYEQLHSSKVTLLITGCLAGAAPDWYRRRLLEEESITVRYRAASWLRLQPSSCRRGRRRCRPHYNGCGSDEVPRRHSCWKTSTLECLRTCCRNRHR